MAAEINAIGLHGRNRARGIDRGVALNQDHARHVSGHETTIIGARRCRAALRSDDPIALQLIRELLQRCRLETGENERCFNGLEGGAGRQPGPRGSFAGKPELLRGGLGCSSLGRRVQHVLNGRNASDRLLGKNAQLQRQCAREFSVEIDRAAAHSCDNTSVLNFRSLQLHKDDGLLGAEKILQNADHFEVELFHLIAGENRVSVSLHACAHLAERKDFVRFLGGGGVRSQA